MNTNQIPENDESLRAVLCQWTLNAPLPPRFREQVWRRIAHAGTKRDKPFWAWLRNLVEVAMPRPKVAYSYVAILLLFGVVAGSWAAQRQASRLDAALGSRYVQSVDPFQRPALSE